MLRYAELGQTRLAFTIPDKGLTDTLMLADAAFHARRLLGPGQKPKSTAHAARSAQQHPSFFR
jgi:hypothetical protein